MKKRIISLLLVIVMVLSTAIITTAKQFPDITLENTEKDIFDAINYMSDNGYMVGNGGTDFDPDANVTRGMFIYLLYVYSKDEGTYTTTYTDVSVNAYYYNAVGWAQENGITNGTTATTFSPARALSREQFFAILLNFCNYEDMPYYMTATLTGYSDYSSLDSYARNAMNFAVSHYIYVPENNKLLPNQTISRSLLALYIHKYEVHVRGIQLGIDQFNFVNSPNNFTTELNYYINDSDYENILNFLKGYYTTIPNQVLIDLNEERKAEWFGSCYGLSTVMALDKLGILAFNENFQENAETINDMTLPVLNKEAESIINTYQIAYDFFGNMGDDFMLNDSNIDTANRTLVDAVKEHGCVLFSFFWYDGAQEEDPGHTILAYRYEEADNGDHYIYFYDCETPFYEQIITISSDYEEINIGRYNSKYRSYTEFNFRYDFDTYRYFYDFDGTYNDKNLTFNSRDDITPTSIKNTVEIIVPSYGNYTITNAENESIVVENGVRSGDMTVYSEYRSLNGSSVSDKHYTIDNSSSYTLTSNNSNNEFEIYGSNYNIVVKMEKGAAVTVNNNGKVSLLGAGGDVSVSYICDNNDFDIMEIKGSYSGKAEFTYSNMKTSVTGITNDLDVVYIDCYKNTRKNVTIPHNGNSTDVVYSTN